MDVSQNVEISEEFKNKIHKLADYDSKLKSTGKLYEYGTSGFRYDEGELDRVKVN